MSVTYAALCLRPTDHHSLGRMQCVPCNTQWEPLVERYLSNACVLQKWRIMWRIRLCIRQVISHKADEAVLEK